MKVWLRRAIIMPSVAVTIIGIAFLVNPSAHRKAQVPIFDSSGVPLRSLITSEMPRNEGKLKDFLGQLSGCIQPKGAVHKLMFWLGTQLPGLSVLASNFCTSSGCINCYTFFQSNDCGGDCGFHSDPYASGDPTDCAVGFYDTGQEVCNNDPFTCTGTALCGEARCFQNPQYCNCQP